MNKVSIIKRIVSLGIVWLLFTSVIAAPCRGHFVNPITDICWSCLFPLSIGDVSVVHGHHPDTKNPSLPIEICHARIGLNIGFWEPFALTDVTATPYCFVNMGGLQIHLGHAGQGGRENPMPTSRGGFYYVHWYKYPLIYWLQILTAVGCMQTGEFDIAYLTELDPTWNDDELNFILNPEAALFANQPSQAACAFDAVKATKGLAIDHLFWCAGSQGSMYPLTGTVADIKNPIQAAVLLSERLAFKLHRLALVWDSSPESGSGINGPICEQHIRLIMPKSRYRYQLTNTIADGNHCYPFGHSVMNWARGHHTPGGTDQFGLLIWRKRNCTFL